MIDKNIFCNVPWYETHVYQDGTFGVCCAESHRPLTGKNYNVATHSLAEWFHSSHMDSIRQAMWGDKPLSFCTSCYHKEQHGGDSRRLNNHHKSVIFGRSAFDASFLQSPGLPHFSHSRDNQGQTPLLPRDLHIDLGNWCNLACKMCNATASSTIASQEVRWGIESSRRYLGSDWTRDDQVWQRFVQQLIDIPYLQNIHFMGGETLLTDRLEDLVDRFVAAQRFDVCFSFVTNGTIYRPDLVRKLTQFRRVGFEISIETADAHNAYIRQGTDTDLVLTNIARYRDISDGTSVSVTLRPALNLLSIGYYHTLLHLALDQGLLIKNNLLYSPTFLDCRYLPVEVKRHYRTCYQDLRDQVAQVAATRDFNVSDPNNYRQTVAREIDLVMSLLDSPEPADQKARHAELAAHCRRWDQVYGLDARALYPELESIWDQHGY